MVLKLWSRIRNPSSYGKNLRGRSRKRNYAAMGAVRKNLRSAFNAVRGDSALVASTLNARRSLSNDVNNIFVTSGKSMKLCKSDSIKCSLAPQFSYMRRGTSQNDFDSPYQGVHTTGRFTENMLEEMWAGAVMATGNQSLNSGNTGRDVFTSVNLTTASDTGGSTSNWAYRNQRMVIYKRSIIDRFMNSSDNTLQFTLYYVKTKTPLQRFSSLSDHSRPQSLEGLFTLLNANAKNYDNMANHTQDFRGTDDMDDVTLKEYGVSPFRFSAVRHYYKCVKKANFTLKPGEQCNIMHKMKGLKVFSTATHADHYEYPGLYSGLIIVCRAQLVGDSTGTAVSYGSGQYQHISEVRAKVKYLPNTINYNGLRGQPVAILAANQEKINPETNAKDSGYDEL